MKIRYIAPIALVALLGCKSNESSGGSEAGGGMVVLAKAPKPKPRPAPSAVSSAAVPQGAFEGEIEISVEMKSTAKAPSVMHAVIKGPKVRFDAPAEAMGGAMAGKAYQIIAIDEGKMRTVVDSTKTVVEMDIGKFAEQMKGMTGTAPSAAPANEPPPKINKTGKTDTLVGHSCEEWEVLNEKSEKMTLCIAKGGGWPSIPAALMPGNDWAQKVLDKDSFPLRIVLNDSTGAEKMRMQVTRMDKKPVDDAQFKIPEGYRVMDMSAMMGAMGAMGGAMGAPMGSASGGPQMKMPANVQKMIEEARAKAAAAKK
jgi:hypothetical protein